MSYTLTETGLVLTETQEGVTFPADYRFATVNDYVHGVDRNFEELQWLALGMAGEIDRLRLDAERYQWLETRFVGVDFRWGDPEISVLCFRWPDELSVGREIDQNIDKAIDADKGSVRV